jgi:hypothetical protein
MSKQSKRKSGSKQVTASRRVRRRISSSAIIMLTIGIVAGLGFGWWKIVPREEPITEFSGINSVVRTSDAEFQKLKGRWRRPDGGYIMAINGIADSGAMDAAYFNPYPIHVGNAVASRDGSVTKLFVELRDVNYPGSTYTLTYEPSTDQLQGIYYQAVEQQSFQVMFERMR